MNKLMIALMTGTLLTGTVALADDAVVKPVNKVNQRQVNQQKRIGQGVKSGQLTPNETVNLEKKEAAIHQEVRTDRKVNGGALTPVEKKQVNHQQNQVSKQLYNKKHGDVKRGDAK